MASRYSMKNPFKRLGSLRKENSKRRSAAGSEGAEESSVFDRNDEALNEFEGILRSDPTNVTREPDPVHREKFFADFTGLLSLSNKGSDGSKMGLVLKTMEPYTVGDFKKSYGGLAGDDYKAVLGVLYTSAQALHGSCASYIENTNPWTSSGKKRKALVQAAFGAARSDMAILRKALDQGEYENIVFQKAYERGANGNELIQILYQIINSSLPNDAEEQQDAKGTETEKEEA